MAFIAIIGFLFTCICVVAVFRRIKGTFLNTVSLYVLPWLVCVLLACTGLFGIYTPSGDTVFYITLGVIGFFLGALFVQGFVERRGNLVPGNKVMPVELGSGVFREKLFILLEVVAVLYDAFLATRTIPYLFSDSGMAYIKYEYANGVGTTLFSTRELLLFQDVAIPVFELAFLVFAYRLSQGKLDKLSLVFSIIGLALTVCVSAGRNIVFVFLVFCLIGILMSPERKSLWRKFSDLPVAIKIGIVAAVVVLVVITQQRSLSADAGVLENVFFYFAGPITYFDQIVASPDSFDLFGDSMLGSATFGFVTNLVNMALTVLFGFSYQGSDSVISTAVNVYLPFSDQLAGNALCTCLYPFMRDFGFAGLVLGPFLFAVIAGFVWDKKETAEQNHSVWSILAIYVGYSLVFAEWRYVLLYPSAGVLVVLVLLVLYGSKKREES